MGMSQTSLKSLPASKRASIIADYRASYSTREFLALPDVAPPRPALPKSKTFGPFPTFKPRTPVKQVMARKPSRTRTLHEHGHVYILIDELQYDAFGVVKIGMTTDLLGRIKEANAWGKYTYLDYVEVSDMLSCELDMQHIFTDEWDTRERFVIDKDIAVSVLALVARKYPPTIQSWTPKA